ncbi:MAG: hypothetical protein HUJ52_03325 [Malacoplasma sp.]|nr:hypothetical protein [Malacoplasma sp.]
MENITGKELVEVDTAQNENSSVVSRREKHKKHSILTFVCYLIVFVYTIISACLITYVAYQAGLVKNNDLANQSMVLAASSAALCWLHVITLSALMYRIIDMVKTANDFRFWVDQRIIRISLISTIFVSLIAFGLQIASNCLYAELGKDLNVIAYNCSVAASLFTGLICLTIIGSIINSEKARKIKTNEYQQNSTSI